MRYGTHYVVKCKGPKETEWSTLTSFAIGQAPGDTEGAAQLRARDAAAREAQAWQRQYQPLADHLFKVEKV